MKYPAFLRGDIYFVVACGARAVVCVGVWVVLVRCVVCGGCEGVAVRRVEVWVV